jgi:hypothetical protein
MAQTPESKVKDKIKAILNRRNVYWVMPIGTGFGNAGVPDFLCSVPPHGRFLAIEAKANGGKTTALQEKHLAEIRDTGAEALVVDENNYFELEGLLEDMGAKNE